MPKHGLELFDLRGKNAIVTGAARGLGRGMATALIEAGAQVLIVDYSETVALTAKEIGAKYIQADLSDIDALPTFFDEAVGMLGGLDILINNAGIISRSFVEDTPFDEWRKVVNLNLDVVFRLCQLAGNIMLAQGSGKIINIASMLSFSGGYTIASYAASKGGVAQLTKAISNEWAGKGICVNAIAPGYFDTVLNSALKANEVRNKELSDRIPLGRWGVPEDLGGAAIFLSSSASDYVTGVVLPVDGGFLSR